MGSKWDNSEYRSGWFAGKRHEEKKRPLWIFVGFCLREVVLFVIWSFTHTY